MRQITLTLLIISVSIMPAQANAEAVETESPAYQAAMTAGKCAGLYEFLTVLYRVKRDHSRINNAMTESEHWRATTKAAFSAAGLKRVKVIVNTDETIEKERVRYMYYMESTPKHLYGEIETGLETCEKRSTLKDKYLPKD